jgi:RimJ/RimL family protein N-acetyltransferase
VPHALLPHYVIRQLGPDDRDALAHAFTRLSPESRRRRFLGPKPALSARELRWMTEIDHVSHEALAAVAADGRIVAVARYNAWHDRAGAADLAVAVIDEWQGRRIGSRLARQAIARARANGFALLTGTTLWDNRPARRMLKRLGFRTVAADGALLDLELCLSY